MNCIYVVIVIVYLSIKGVLVVTPFYAPRFISDWYNATARDKNSSLITIRHGLYQYPAKVDVQIKVHVNDQDNIFTGVGSAQRDDLNYEYGGIVYKYNTDHVLLLTPFRPKVGNESDKGNPRFYTGPANWSTLYLSGHVRVRVWLDSDMAELVFNSSVYMNVVENYTEIQHNLGYYPDIVTVQTKMDDGYMSDGQDRCPYPENGNGTYIVQIDLRPGGYVKYSCNESLDLITGSLIRYCLLHQTWYGDLPVCEELPNSNTTKNSTTFETIRIDKKSTSKYRRTLISVWDDRPSVMCIGGFSILLVVLPLCICILPDIYIMCKHVICHASIYQRGTPKNKASTSKVSATKEGSKSKNNVEFSYRKRIPKVEIV